MPSALQAGERAIDRSHRRRAWQQVVADVGSSRLNLVPVTPALVERAAAILGVCHPAVALRSLDAIHLALCRLSQLLIDLPEVVDVDVNPLLADDEGLLALDARIRVASAAEASRERIAIRPYPQELEERIPWEGRVLLLRPIRP